MHCKLLTITWWWSESALNYCDVYACYNVSLFKLSWFPLQLLNDHFWSSYNDDDDDDNDGDSNVQVLFTHAIRSHNFRGGGSTGEFMWLLSVIMSQVKQVSFKPGLQNCMQWGAFEVPSTVPWSEFQTAGAERRKPRMCSSKSSVFLLFSSVDTATDLYSHTNLRMLCRESTINV